MDKYEVTFQDGSKGTFTQEQIDGLPPDISASVVQIQIVQTPITPVIETPSPVDTNLPIPIPQTTTAVDLVTSTENILKQYQDALEKVKQNQYSGIQVGQSPDIAIAQIEQEIKTWQAKLDYLYNIRDYEASIADAKLKAAQPDKWTVDPNQLVIAEQNLSDAIKYGKNLIDPSIAVYVTVTPDGKFVLQNLLMAKQTNVDLSKLTDLGFKEDDIQKQIETEQTIKNLGTYPDLAQAIREGKIADVRKAVELGLITEEQLLDAQIGSAEIGSADYQKAISDAASEKLKDFVNDIGQLRLSEAIKAGIDYDTMKEAGYTISKSEYDAIKNKLETPRNVGYEITDIEDYKSGSGYDLAKYLRENPNQEEYLKSIGFSQESITQASNYNNLPYVRKTAQDKIYEAFYKAGGSLIGKNSPEELDQILKDNPEILSMPSSEPQQNLKPDISFERFVAEYVIVRKDLPEYKSITNTEARLTMLKNMAASEYMRLYGKGTMLGSQGTDILEFVAPAARSLHEEYDIKDITAVEWAITGANIALIAVSPVLGKIGGSVAKGITKTTELIASAVYPVVTVVQWKNMSAGERIINVAMDATIVGAIAGKTVVNGIKNLNPGVGFTRRVDDIAKAVQSADATKVWVSASKLEKYGETLEKSGIKTGTRIKEYGTFIKNNADIISKSYRSNLPYTYDILINELKSIDKAMSELRQKGAMAIDPRTGKVIDTDTGLEMTPQRQMEKIREKTRVTTIERLTDRERQSFKQEFNLFDDEIDELVNLTGGDRRAMRDLAQKRMFKKMQQDIFDRMNKDAELQEEKALAQSEEESLIMENQAREAATRQPVETKYLTIEEQDAINKELADEVAQAARQVSREKAYSSIFPKQRLSSIPEETFISVPANAPIAVREEQEVAKPFSKPQTVSITDTELKELAQTKTATQIALQPLTITQTQALPETKTQTETKLETKLKTETKTDTKTDVKTDTLTDVKTDTLTKTQTDTMTETEKKTGLGFAFPTQTELEKTNEKRRPDINIKFDEDETKREKLEKYGFITWRQGKTHWAIPQREDGSFASDDKVASGKPFRGTTKFAQGKGSVYATMQYVGQNPPEKAFIDLGFAQFNLIRDGADVKITRIHPDETANWEGVNKYSTPEYQSRQEKMIAKYSKQYMKPRYERPKEDNVYEEADKLLGKKNLEPVVIKEGKRTYFGYEILPSDVGGKL